VVGAFLTDPMTEDTKLIVYSNSAGAAIGTPQFIALEIASARAVAFSLAPAESTMPPKVPAKNAKATKNATPSRARPTTGIHAARCQNSRLCRRATHRPHANRPKMTMRWSAPALTTSKTRETGSIRRTRPAEDYGEWLLQHPDIEAADEARVVEPSRGARLRCGNFVEGGIRLHVRCRSRQGKK
jgi:hypothetical protein